MLAALAVISDIFASGLAGSSHHRASPYSIAMASFVSFIVTLTGTTFVTERPLVTAGLSAAVLVLAYVTWRNNIAYIT